ncbi:glycosyltransferase family 2 protein [Geomonas edaphica]|uniref:glycosyltransferase family 2 protein n=1 Tax=Geomonas edaphica TaxID=2570226 RepID=UPI0010A7EDF4|nr:glycosyltransferase family 2 protein [Geomonas edaphica]
MNLIISVCIPSYNRSEVLPPLLESILSQDLENFEVVICEDKSPQRERIRSIVEGFRILHPHRIRYFENEENLGYDGNFRNLIEKANGDYCLFMGNDDLMCPGALKTVASALGRHDNIGVVLRSYAAFNGSPKNVVQTFRYFDRELFFPFGASTIATFYRRSVVIPGVTIHREAALRYGTDRFDGTLLYQLYLVANILTEMNGVFLPEILALYRTGGIPDFGNSEKERGLFVPEAQTPESSVHFVAGMLNIAAWVEKSRGVKIYSSILQDICNYSYPILSIQSHQSLPVFVKYALNLAKLGFWRSGIFYCYFTLLLIFGSRRVDFLIRIIKKRLGYTPAIGSVYRGESQ